MKLMLIHITKSMKFISKGNKYRHFRMQVLSNQITSMITEV